LVGFGKTTKKVRKRKKEREIKMSTRRLRGRNEVCADISGFSRAFLGCAYCNGRLDVF
jgi:hypothetical protein